CTGFILFGFLHIKMMMNTSCLTVVNCSDPGFVENAIRHGQQNYPESFKYGTSVAYHCKKGFYLLGSSALTCKSNGFWDRSLPKCLSISCGHPGVPANAVLSGDKFTYGSIIHYSCTAGRRLIGNSTRECQEDSHWSGTLPHCSGNNPGYCDDPGIPAHGSRLGDEFKIKSLLRFSCEMGYQLRGSSERTCLLNGSWSAVSCGNPGTPANGMIIYSDGILFSSSVIYACWEGYKTSGLTTRHCTANGTWTGTAPDCTAITCGPPPPVLYGKVEGSDYRWGASIQLTIRVQILALHILEYKTVPEVMSLAIMSILLKNIIFIFHQAIHSDYSCCKYKLLMFLKAHACRQPETPAHVDVKAIDLPTLGYTLVYTCQPGFFLAGGSEHRTCKPDMKWTGKSPICKRLNFPDYYLKMHMTQ
ncbi:hypothetical protein CIB84_003385, partial [Bambusicola thoracicus]